MWCLLRDSLPRSIHIGGMKYTVELTIETTDAAIKGQTASSSYKPATLDNGINILVPPFIDNDDTIVVDTRTMEYIKKI